MKYPEEESLWQTRNALPAFPRGAAAALMLLTAGLAGVFGAGGMSALPVMMLLTAIYAVLIILCRSPIVLLPLPAAYGIAFFFCRDPLAALMSLAFAPAAAVIVVCLFRRRKCFRTTLWLTLVTLLLSAGIAAVAIVKQYGTLDEGIRAVLAESDRMLAEEWEKFLASLGTTAAAQYDEIGKALLQNYRYLLPGLAVLSAMIVSWVSCKLTRRFLIWLHADKFFFKKSWNIMVPPAWAYAYIVTTLATLGVSLLALNDDTSWTVFAITDLLLLLEPPLIAIGFRRIRLTLRRLRRGGLIGPYIALVIGLVGFAVCTGFDFLPFLFSYLGTLYVIRRYKAKKRKKALADAEEDAEDAPAGTANGDEAEKTPDANETNDKPNTPKDTDDDSDDDTMR